MRNRTVLENQSHYDQELWSKIVELGWTGIRIPEEYDGLGLGHLELCVIAEELGRFLAPVPFSSSVYLFTEAIIKYGSEEMKKDLLPKLVSGDVIGTLAVTEDLFAPSKDNIKLSCESGKINGKKIAQELRNELKKEIDNLSSKIGKVPGLAVVQVGNVAASSVYVKAKTKSAKERNFEWTCFDSTSVVFFKYL